jgi:hypothetical protein
MGIKSFDMKKLFIIGLFIVTLACRQKSAKDEPTTISESIQKDSAWSIRLKCFSVLPKQADESENNLTDSKIKIRSGIILMIRLSNPVITGAIPA